MIPEILAIGCAKIIDGDFCAVCRKAVGGESFFHTCGWLFCSQACSDIGSADAKAHARRIVEAIRGAVAAEREACAKMAEFYSQYPGARSEAAKTLSSSLAAAIRQRGRSSESIPQPVEVEEKS